MSLILSLLVKDETLDTIPLVIDGAGALTIFIFFCSKCFIL